MAFDLEAWRAEVRRSVGDFARDPRGALGLAGVETVYGFLLGSTILPVVAAYAADPAGTIGAVIGVLGGLGANLLANLAQRAYDEAPIAVAAAEAQRPEQAPAYQAIAQQTEVFQLAEQALQQAGQAEVLAQLRDELRRLAPGGPFADATITQQQGGGVNIGVGNTISLVGDVAVGSQTRGQVDNQGRIEGVAVGINLGTIVYGRTPQEDERRRLVWYLDALANKLYRLPLRGIEQRLDQGEGMALPQVYVMLATTSLQTIFIGEYEEHRQYFVDGDMSKSFKPEYHPDTALPPQALLHIEVIRQSSPSYAVIGEQLARAQLVTESVHNHQTLVLLGDPGSGKSTFLRHMAWALGQRGLDQVGAPALLGWPDDAHALPLLLPLRTLANHIATYGAQPSSVVAALSTELIKSYNVREAEALVEQVLHSDGALLLLDGLDEVPIEAAPGRHTDRRTVLRVVREFAQLYPRARIALTCRTRAFDEALRAELGWPVETIAPFTLGQIRHFVPAWYGELVAHGQLNGDQASAVGQKLIEAITDPQRSRLRTMAENPLLLTLMALVLFNQGELPRDRPLLYERVLDLLLGQWDKVKAHGGESLAEAVGMPGWESRDFLPLLDRLCYEAHRDASSADGRGRIGRGALTIALIDFFKAARVPSPGEAALRCLDYFEQRSGLLAADGRDTYVFAHLTLQEHGAGRYLAVQSDDPAGLLLQHRADDRWREPIMLGAGLLRPGDLNALLADLIDREEANVRKPDARWYRDLILAAEIGADRDWDVLRTRPAIKVERLQRELRAGLVALLADQAQPLPVAERVRAGDPRVPVTLDEWRRELAKIERGDISGYFCRVEAGTYTIGSADDDPDAKADEKPQHQVTFDAPFWIARYPVTNDQWQLWVGDGGGKASYAANDTNLNIPNQPVVGVSWDMCNDFCAWLCQWLDVEVRLPSEHEWESAARGGDSRRYPWGPEWIADHAATAEDRETRGAQYTVPIGCYPAGAAPCGALDMAGNVWEWTASVWQAYPGAEKAFTEKDWQVLRGGGWNSTRDRVRCGARSWDYPSGGYDGYGFRLVVAPRSH